MAEKKITVVIDGQEFVSKAADSAGGAMDGFAGKIPGWGKAIALATAAFAILSKAVEAVGDFVMGSIDAYDKFATSQNKMSAQSKLTGVSLAELKETAKVARDEFNLGSVVANEAATTVAKYASRAGDAAKKNELLAAALDLGAASGYSAAESMDALEQGLRGQDEGFDKLLGKNPSALWKEYADANGLAVGKMTDTQKRMAELTAIVDAGNIVQGAYNERIASGAGQTEAMSNQMDNAKVAFGAAIQPLRIFIVQGLVKLIELATPVAVGIARVSNAVGVLFVGSFQLARSAVGALIEGVGKLTGNKSLEEWGAKQAAAFPEFVRQLDAMEKKLNTSGEAATQHGTQHALATVKIVASAKENTKAVSESADAINAKLDAKLGEPLKNLIGITEGAIRSLGSAARDQLPPETAAKFNEHMAALAANAERVRERLTATGPATQAVSRNTKDIASEIGMVARGALEAAGSFGVIDEKASKSLTSAVNIATALGNMALNGFSFAGVTGIIGGVASIVSVMMAGDVERRQLQRESNERVRDNTARLKELTKEVGLLTLDVAGGEVATIESILEEIVPKLAQGGSTFGGANSFSSIISGATSSLMSKGLGWDSIVALAKKFGINILDKNGAIDFAQLPVLLQALRSTNTAAPSQSFDSQLDILRQGFDVNQTGGLSQIGQIMNLAERFSPALRGVFRSDNIAGTRADLQRLFNDLAAGKLTESQLGGLTGSQFLNIVTDIIGRIDRLAPGVGAGPTGGDGTGGGTTTTSGGVPVATKTLSDVLDGVTAQTTALGAYHIKHLDLATAHLNEAKMQTDILTDIADSVRPLRDGGITTIADKGREAERLSLAAERGIGASF